MLLLTLNGAVSGIDSGAEGSISPAEDGVALGSIFWENALLLLARNWA